MTTVRYGGMMCGVGQVGMTARPFMRRYIMTNRAILNVEQLEDRCAPIVHSFSAAATHSDSPNAGGTQATNAILFQSALGATPVPIVASFGNSQGVPFQTGSVPGR